MGRRISFAYVSLVAVALGGCSIPRGAPSIQALRMADSSTENQTPVVTVARKNVEDINISSRSLDPQWFWPNENGKTDTDQLRAGDKISVTIWDSEPNSLLTSGDQRSVVLPPSKVDKDGAIFLPYAGRVEIAHLHSNDAQKKIQDAVRQRVPAAEVQIDVIAGSQNSVQIVQGVPRPGIYPVADGASHVMAALSQVGGIDPSLRNPVVRLIRGNQTFETQAEDILDGRAADIRLRGGDKLIVTDDPRQFTALGATTSEQMVPFDRDEISAIEAIAMANGLSDSSADPKSVLILRTNTGSLGKLQEDVIYAIDLTSPDGLFAARSFLIRNGDTVLATESPLSSTRTILLLIASMAGISNALAR